MSRPLAYLPKRLHKRLLYVFVSLCCSLVVIACSPPVQERVSCIAENTPINLQQSESLNTSIYVDGTLSMQGYVVPGAETRYGQTLQTLESIATTAWAGTKSSVQYYRFGTKSRRIERSSYRNALTPGFYGGGEDVSVAAIDSVIQPPQDDSLTIIVTDLYQKNADIALVQDAINKNYLVNGFAVGVLGLRSEFNGTVFDVGLANRSFQYNTSGLPPERWHPFYVIFLGKIGNIQYFVEQFRRAKPALFQQSNFDIFYSSPVTQTATINSQNLPNELPKGFRRPKSINDGTVMIQASTANDVDFLISDGKAGEQKLSYNLRLRLLPNALRVNPQFLIPEVRNQRYRKGEGFGASDQVFGQISSVNFNNDEMNLEAALNPDNLQKGVYLFRASFKPTAFEERQWWQAWNASENQMDGSRTHKLLVFMQDLKRASETLMKKQSIPAAELCIVLQQR